MKYIFIYETDKPARFAVYRQDVEGKLESFLFTTSDGTQRSGIIQSVMKFALRNLILWIC